jgi:hypothetical protein
MPSLRVTRSSVLTMEINLRPEVARLTREQLVAKHACGPNLDMFDRSFPLGYAIVTPDLPAQYQHLFRWGWTLIHLLKPQYVKQYADAVVALRKTLDVHSAAFKTARLRALARAYIDQENAI